MKLTCLEKFEVVTVVCFCTFTSRCVLWDGKIASSDCHFQFFLIGFHFLLKIWNSCSFVLPPSIKTFKMNKYPLQIVYSDLLDVHLVSDLQF